MSEEVHPSFLLLLMSPWFSRCGTNATMGNISRHLSACAGEIKAVLLKVPRGVPATGQSPSSPVTVPCGSRWLKLPVFVLKKRMGPGPGVCLQQTSVYIIILLPTSLAWCGWLPEHSAGRGRLTTLQKYLNPPKFLAETLKQRTSLLQSLVPSCEDGMLEFTGFSPVLVEGI